MEHLEAPPADVNLTRGQYADIIKIWARRVARQYSFMHVDDLKQVGYEALLHARDTYDSNRGASFRTHADLTICHAMFDAARREKKQRRIGRMCQEAIQQDSSPQDDSESTGYALRARRMKAFLYNVLDRCAVASQDDAAPDRIYEAREQALKLQEGKEQLTPREREWVELTLGEGLSTDEIAALMGVDKTTVSKTKATAQKRLRRILNGEGRRLSDGEGGSPS